MDAVNKPNDWFATRFLNPDQTPESLVVEGISTSNTKIEDREYYRNIPEVKEAYTDEYGTFKEREFNDTYDQYLAEYQYLSGINNRDFVLQFYEKNPGVFSVSYGHFVDPSMSVSKVNNPLEQTYGLTTIGEWSEPTISAKEAAQKNRIYIPDKG
jgi:hypothetical protein